jgi:hypothetical protein
MPDCHEQCFRLDDSGPSFEVLDAAVDAAHYHFTISGAAGEFRIARANLPCAHTVPQNAHTGYAPRNRSHRLILLDALVSTGRSLLLAAPVLARSDVTSGKQFRR